MYEDVRHHQSPRLELPIGRHCLHIRSFLTNIHVHGSFLSANITPTSGLNYKQAGMAWALLLTRELVISNTLIPRLCHLDLGR